MTIAMNKFTIGDRVQVINQPAIVGTVVRYDTGNKYVVLDDDRDEWKEDGEEGCLIFRGEDLNTL
jgi:hypothetical protein